jgi:hypothetical protein
MAQSDVLDFLKDQAVLYPDKRFTAKEIIAGLKDTDILGTQDGNIRRCLSKLSHYRVIDCETIGWKRTFKYEVKK